LAFLNCLQQLIDTFHFDQFLFDLSVFFEEAPCFAPVEGEETSEDEKTDGEEGGENRQRDVNLLANEN